MDYSGKTLDGRYHLTKLLGQGGMGAVYMGQHTIIGKQVAVKFLHAEFTSNEEVLKRFYREAQAAASIGHKNIIDVMDVGVSPDGDPYLVMEYLEGEDLDNMLKRTGPLDFPTALGILEPALLALAAAHSKGIVHRDLKPANIFLVHQEGEAPAIKLIDFGISKFTRGNDQTKLTQTGSLLGTPAYMSPEQARGTGTIDQRTDLYAMGVILFQMLTGQLPFEGENYNDLLIRVLTEPHKPPREAYANFPVEAEDLITKSLAKDPAARFQTSMEMIDSLKQFSAYEKRAHGMTMLASGLQTQCFAAGDLGSEVGKGTKPSATGVLQQMAREGTPGAWAGTAVEKPSVGKKGLLIGLIGLATLVIVAVLVVLFALKNQPQPLPAVAPIAALPPAQVLPEGQGVEIKVEGVPEGAKIFWDKGPVPMNPFRVKKAVLLSQLRVEADGFKPFIASVVPKEDKVIEVKLKPDDPPAEVAEVQPAETEETGKNSKKKKKKKSSKSDPAPPKEEKKVVITAKPEPKPDPPPKPKPPKKDDKNINKGGRGTLFSEDFE